MNTIEHIINSPIKAMGFTPQTTIAVSKITGIAFTEEDTFIGFSTELFAGETEKAEGNSYIPEGIRKGRLRNIGGRVSIKEFNFETDNKGNLTETSISSLKDCIPSKISNLLEVKDENFS